MRLIYSLFNVVSLSLGKRNIFISLEISCISSNNIREGRVGQEY